MTALYQTGAGPPGPQRAAALAAADDPARYLPNPTRAPLVQVWLDCGRSDPLPRSELGAVRRELAARGQVAALTIRAGGHDYGVWRPALRAALSWAAPTLNH